ncbi:MAG TPA: hypothetical protein VK171_04045 [Fimbriimonas sp.]|nr:hypothetical protein [Fimbriimonas sp.]
MTFEEFYGNIFGHEDWKSGWDLDDLAWELEDVQIAEYMLRTFRDSATLFKGRNPDQIGFGLYFLFNSHSSYWWNVRSKSVPQDLQVETVSAVGTLYTTYLDVVCDDFGRTPAANTNGFDKIDGFTYMMWDMSCIEGAAWSAGEEHLVEPIYNVLQTALNCKSVACQISGLHGLGHLHLTYPDRTELLVGEFINSGRARLPWVNEYAEQAFYGNVL